MHFCRMRTARFNGHLRGKGVSSQEEPLTQREIPPPPTPVDRQTPVKTLPPQTAFAGGKNDKHQRNFLVIFACWAWVLRDLV